MPKTVEFIIVSGWVLLMIVCFTLIGGVVILYLLGHTVADELLKLAGVALGFVTGSIPPLIKDLLASRSTTP